VTTTPYAPTPDPRRVKPASDRDAHDNWTRVGGKEPRWYHRDWTVSEATSGAMAEAFLAADPDDTTGWMGQDMRVEDETGRTLAVLVHPDRLRKASQFAQSVQELKEQPTDTALHPAVHGPGGGGDGMLIDTGAIQDQLALLIARRAMPKELPERSDEEGWEKWRAEVQAAAEKIRRSESDWLIAAAVEMAYTMAPYKDTQGVVPIRAWHTVAQEGGPQQEQRWSLAYETPARGLYVKAGAPNFWGEDWVVVSGSGYVVRGGFFSREVACAYAVAIATAVPGIDFRCWSMELPDTPPGISDVVRAVNLQWDPYGPRQERAAGTEEL
jgi:hypothetical protein